jgi:hypothetical protein
VTSERPADDVAAGVIRVTIDGQEFVLPVLRIKAEREWKAGLREMFGRQLAGQDGETVGLERLGEFSNLAVDTALDLVASYDRSGIFGGRDWLEEHAYQAELFAVLREIWAVVFLPLAQAGQQLPALAGGTADGSSIASSSTNGRSPIGASIPTDSSGG